MRVAPPPELRDFIAQRIAFFPTEATEQMRRQSEYVSEFSALPLYYGWTDTIGIRADGELISWSTEWEYAGTRPVKDRVWMIVALISGSERYEPLRALLPNRPTDAADCDACFNKPVFAAYRLFCGKCGGIGWLPKSGGQG